MGFGAHTGYGGGAVGAGNAEGYFGGHIFRGRKKGSHPILPYPLGVARKGWWRLLGRCERRGGHGREGTGSRVVQEKKAAPAVTRRGRGGRSKTRPPTETTPPWGRRAGEQRAGLPQGRARPPPAGAPPRPDPPHALSRRPDPVLRGRRVGSWVTGTAHRSPPRPAPRPPRRPAAPPRAGAPLGGWPRSPSAQGRRSPTPPPPPPPTQPPAPAHRPAAHGAGLSPAPDGGGRGGSGEANVSCGSLADPGRWWGTGPPPGAPDRPAGRQELGGAVHSNRPAGESRVSPRWRVNGPPHPAVGGMRHAAGGAVPRRPGRAARGSPRRALRNSPGGGERTYGVRACLLRGAAGDRSDGAPIIDALAGPLIRADRQHHPEGAAATPAAGETPPPASQAGTHAPPRTYAQGAPAILEIRQHVRGETTAGKGPADTGSGKPPRAGKPRGIGRTGADSGDCGQGFRLIADRDSD